MKKIRKQAITNETKILIPLLLLSLALVFTFCVSDVSAAPGDIYVNTSSGNDAWDGLSAVYTSGTNGPKATITNATDTVNSGGTVYIANGTYNENNINISRNMNIIGESQKNTVINGGSSGTIFYIQPGVNVKITNITLTNGRTSSNGGALWNQTRLYGQDKYNGGAINNQGTLTVTNCNFTNNYANNNGAGGAIYNYGTLTVTGSTFTNNHATMGGAIYNLGTATINNSTFTGNSANSGGAIFDSAGIVNVHYCRIAGNSASSSGSNVYSPGGTTYANNNWWGSNSSPAGISGTVTANNWVILTVTASPTTVNSGGTSTITADLNHINGGGVLTGGSIPEGIPVIFSSTLGSINPVSAVTSNGQATATFTSTAYSGIAAGSATADSVKVSAPITITNAEIYVSTTGSDTTGDGSAGNPYQTISKGITCVSPGGNVHIADGTYTGTNNTGITISKNLNIIGQSQTGTIINGNHAAQIFNIVSGVTVTIQNLTLANGTTTTYGGAIYNRGTLTVTNCSFTGNTAGWTGGAIYNRGGTLTVTNCNFTGNTASGGYSGGAIGNDGNSGAVNIVNSTFSNNTASGSYSGGAIFNYGTATVNIANSMFSNNTASGSYSGGAIGNYGYSGTATVYITNCTFSNNTASGSYSGGAIFNFGDSGTATVNIANSTLCNNTATGLGGAGAIYNYYSSGTAKIHVDFSRIVGNTGKYTIINNYGAAFDADYNWWGTNNPNWSNLIYGFANPRNWVILTVNANPTTINNRGTSTITVDFNHINGGRLLTGGHIPDGIPVTFTTAWGSFTQSLTTTVNGQATTTFNADGTSNPTTNPVQIYAVADNENSVYTPVNVIIPTTTTVNAVHNFAGQAVNLTAHVDAFGNPIGTSGQVTFIVNHAGTMVNVGTAPVINGVATLNWAIPSNWNIGTYTITAIFDGTGTNYLNSANSNILAVDPTPTTVTVDAVHNFVGQTVNLVAHVKDYYNNLVDGGQATFTVNGVNAGTVNVNNGVATLTWTIPLNWNVGTNGITADFDGTGTNYANSTNSGVLTVDSTPTSVTVDNIHNFPGQTVTLTANVKDYYNHLVNGGAVTFTINHAGTVVNAGTANVNSGVATLTWTIPSDWNIGTNDVTADFDGTGTNYVNSTGEGNLTVDQTPTSVIAASVHNFAGQNVTLTAHVNDYYGHSVNEGFVKFTVNGSYINTVSVNNGEATVNWTIPGDWSTGNYTILTDYLGTGNFIASNGTENLTVDPTPTSIMAVNVTGVNGQTVNLNVTLTDVYGHLLTGKPINFKINGTSIGSGITDSNGIAILTYKLNSAGNFTVTAEFVGDSEYINSTGNGTLTADPSADLYVQITSNKINPKVCEMFTLTYKLGNKGPDAAQNVTITIPLLEGFELANIRGDGNWTYNSATRTITWTLANVPVGDPYLYISGKVLSPESYVFSSSISSETYNINTEGVTPITINAVSQVKAASKTTSKTMPLQHTGLPLAGLVFAILAVFGGLIMPKKE